MGSDIANYKIVYDQLLNIARGEKIHYVHLKPCSSTLSDLPVKLIAFYLPQFHPIPENDQWWGRGFTEWTNVTRAIPQFVGHYQPHLPGELGFYDLRVPEIQEHQVELAKMFGIFGFCFYFYWFGGRKLLFKPLEQFISNEKIDFPFCICWANENWTRSWDGLDHQVLIEQRYSPDDDIKLIEDILPIITHPNYICIQGRPLIIVYRPGLLPDPLGTQQRWREYCRKVGVGEIFLAGTETGVKPTEFNINPQKIGFDAIIEFPPNGPLLSQLRPINKDLKFVNPNFSGIVFSYKEAAKLWSQRRLPSHRFFRTVFPSWDNTPRRLDRAVIFHGSTPELYRKWLVAACLSTIQPKKEGERIVFINAWNEWGESNHLEPDRWYGYAYLEATRSALQEVSLKVKTLEVNSKTKVLFCLDQPKVAIVILNYNSSTDTIECIKSCCQLKYSQFQIVVVDNHSETKEVFKLKQWLLHQRQFHKMFLIENPTNLGFSGGNNVGIKYALHSGADYIWILNNDTIVDQDSLAELIRTIESDPKIGIVCSKIYLYGDHSKIQYDGNTVRWEGMPDTAHDYPRTTKVVSGCSLLIKKELLKEIGFFDEDFFLYFEDTDFTLRAIKAGWKVYYQPASKVYHKGGSSIGSWLKTPQSIYYATRNSLLFAYKHCPETIFFIFEQLQNEVFPSIKPTKTLVWAFAQAIEDFINGQKGTSNLPLDESSNYFNKILLEILDQNEASRRVNSSKKDLILNPNNKTVANFIRQALFMYYKRSLKGESETFVAKLVCGRGEYLYRKGKTKKAIILFQKALRIDPNCALAYNNLATVFWEKKMKEKALKYIQQARNLDPSDKDIMWNWGQIMLTMGKAEEVLKAYKSYLEKYPGETEIRDLICHLQNSERLSQNREVMMEVCR